MKPSPVGPSEGRGSARERGVRILLGALALALGTWAGRPAFAQEVEPAAAQLGAGTEPEGAAEVGAVPFEAEYAPGALRDPIEPFNRAMFAVNEVVDRAAVEPIARGYRAVTPRFVRTGVSNFLDNLGAPVTFANDVLQGDITRAGTTLGRFTLNTAFGVAGLFDPATSIGLEDHDEDFGQTLGKWGVGPGPYLYLPLIGPSTLRDSLGRGVDVVISPWTYNDAPDADLFNGVRGGMGALAGRESAIEAIENLRNSSTDPYVTLRSLYSQARASAIRNGQQDVEDLPDFGDEP